MGVYIKHREDLRQIIKGLQSQGKRIVFTNGVFDLVHVGHIRSLGDAKQRGDFLVVAINSDASTRQLKGTGHPVNPLAERVEVLCAMSCIDYVTVLEEQTADALLEYLKPNIHAKGTDYTEETVPERETVLGYGGEIAIVGDPKDHSTTSLIEKIGKLYGKAGKGKKPAARKARASKTVKKKKAKKKVQKKKVQKKKKVTKKATKKKKTAKKKVKKKPAKAPKKRSAASKPVKKKAKTPAKKAGHRDKDLKGRPGAAKKTRKASRAKEMNAY
jgi:rfaE bifunctional protein nucleotidyltransferase chain/domain